MDGGNRRELELIERLHLGDWYESMRLQFAANGAYIVKDLFNEVLEPRQIVLESIDTDGAGRLLGDRHRVRLTVESHEVLHGQVRHIFSCREEFVSAAIELVDFARKIYVVRVARIGPYGVYPVRIVYEHVHGGQLAHVNERTFTRQVKLVLALDPDASLPILFRLLFINIGAFILYFSLQLVDPAFKCAARGSLLVRSESIGMK